MNEYERERMRCHQCGNVVTMMWGHTCNKCRKQNEQSEELIEAIKENSSKKYSASEVRTILDNAQKEIAECSQQIFWDGDNINSFNYTDDINFIFTKTKANL